MTRAELRDKQQAELTALVTAQENAARAKFDGNYSVRSLKAVATAIGEDEPTARGVLASIGASESHTGRSGKRYFRLN